MIFYTAVIAGLILGFVGGAARARVAFAPWLAAGAALFAYLVLLAVASGWAARCWDCAYTSDDTRGFIFGVWAVWGGATAAAVALGAWAGSALARKIARI